MAYGGARFFAATSLFALSAAAQAGETVTYSYDTLGRLTASSSSGTVNNGLSTTVAYDPAGNRSTYAVTGAAGSPPPPPPVPPPAPPVSPPPPWAPPPPPPANLPPVANPDWASARTCAGVFINVLANDSDPEGSALTLVSVTAGSLGRPSLSGTSVHYTAYGAEGGDSFTYVVRDSLGATASGSIDVTVLDQGGCQ